VNELQEELRRLVGLSAATAASRPSTVSLFSREVAETATPEGAAVVRELLSVAGPAAPPSGTGVTSELAALRQQLAAVRESTDRQSEVMETSFRALSENSSSRGADWLGALREFASGVRGGGGGGFSLAASPIASLLSRLLFRRTAPIEEPLSRFSLPDPVRLDAALSTGREGLAGVDYSAAGAPRRVERTTAAAATPITIQVQTMDSRSFLDNSDQIARAVREAMLNSHSLNDVIGEM
jgi:hypothetical protein